MARTIAAAEALNQLGDSAQELASMFAGMSDTGRDFAAQLINTKDANGEFHAEDVFASMTQGELENFALSDFEGMLEILGLTEDQFTALATTMSMTSEELQDFLSSGVSSVQTSFENIGKNLTE